MKAKSVALFGLGVIAGLLLAPRKGSESYYQLKDKVNDLYLQSKELNMESVKDKMYDIKIEVAKMDYDRSKEIIAKQAEVIREKLSKIITDLQENENIKPAMNSAVNATEKAIIDVITFIDENDLYDKSKDHVKKTYDKTAKYAENIKEKSGEFASEVKEKSSEIAAEVKEQAQKVSDNVADLKDEAVEKVTKKAKNSKSKKQIEKSED